MLIAPPFIYVQVLYGVVRFRGEEYRVGTSVFLRPGSFKFKNSASVTLTKKDSNKDQKVCVIMSDILQICGWLLCTGKPCLPQFKRPMGNYILSSFLGTFAKLQKATISFVMFVCLSVHVEQLGFHWTNFNEILYLSIFWKSVAKIEVSLRLDKNYRYFTWRGMYILYHISISYS